MIISAIIALVCCGLVSANGVQTKCIESETMKISLTSNYNQTGQWQTQVLFTEGHSEKATSSPLTWLVDVHQNSLTCDGDKSLLETTIYLTAPPKNLPSDQLNAGLCPQQRRVPNDYFYFDGVGYYKFHTTPKTWPDALETCRKEGAHLVIINSEKESEVVKSLAGLYPAVVGASSREYLWVGVHRIGQTYYTIFGEELEKTGFSRWSPGDPHRGAEYCGLLYKANGGYCDVTCAWVVAFVCEYEVTELTTQNII